MSESCFRNSLLNYLCFLVELIIKRVLRVQYKSRYEGDLVAKCYFAKHKLVWEVLDGGLKNKIEIQWSDIMALKATYQDDSPGTLHVVVIKHSVTVLFMFLFHFISAAIIFSVSNQNETFSFCSFRS